MCSSDLCLDRSDREDVRLHQPRCHNASAYGLRGYVDNTLPSCCYVITMILRVRRNFFEITTFPNRRSPRKKATPAATTPAAPPRRSPRKKTTLAGASSTSAAGHRGTFHAPRQTGRKRTISYKMKEYLYASGN